MPRTVAPLYRKHLIALAATAALAPGSIWALDLAEAPPGTVEPYVRPNVILSLDDSTSMNARMNDSSGNSLGTRTSVLVNAVRDTFSDTSLLPDGKIRLAWQTMNNCVSVAGSKAGTLLTGADASSGTKKNVMRLYGGGHRSFFMDFLDNYNACGNTPTHDLMKAADDYLRASPPQSKGPWSGNPNGTDAESTKYLGCRKNFHVVLTDGGWNGTERKLGTRNYDGNPSNWPANIPTAPVSQTRLFSDDEDYTTIADWAFYSWANPLQPAANLTGVLEPSKDYRTAPATETFTNRITGTTSTLDRFWNPRYNPATWANLVTFTIGFSGDALPKRNYIGGTHVSNITPPTSLLPYGYDGNFVDYANGTYNWYAKTKDKGHDMWHAAINSRGQFYAVEKGEDLKAAFRQIIGNIQTATDPDLSSSATSSSNPARSDVGRYIASYEPVKSWKGFVSSDKIKLDGTIIANPDWSGETTSDKLDLLPDPPTSRVVLSWSTKWDGTQYKGGVPFKWEPDESKLSTAQKLWLQKDVNGTDEGTIKGQQRLNYIRGDRSREGSKASNYSDATKPYRERQSRQGDIVNSDIWYTGAPAGNSLLKGYADFVRANKARPAMLYVGGNDGMLHGFAAANGDEKIAYVPKGVIPGLTLLTHPQYNNGHKYFVDGSPMTGDVDLNGGRQDPADATFTAYTPDWRTLLVGTLGLGGKGYFVLDVTNPKTSGVNIFSDANAAQLVKLDRTRGGSEAALDCTVITDTDEKTACEQATEEDRDIGYITARPVRDDNDAMRSTQITRMNNNRWAVVLGNGYNSANQRPVLLVQYLDGDKALLRIPATTDAAGTGIATDNGLASPRLVDLNGDGRADVVYAGDNLGNMWKFDLTNADASNWAVAFSGNPLFTAGGPIALGSTTRTTVQPISTAPTVRANDRSKKVGAGPTEKTVRVGGMMVAFGTGRNTGRNDPSSVDVQTLYSVLDNTRYREVGTGAAKRLEVHPGGGTCPGGADCVPVPAALGTGVIPAKLAQQTFTAISTPIATDEYAAVDVVEEIKTETWKNFNGWYLDLPAIGERLLKPMEFYDGSNLLTVWSQVPAKGSDVDPNVESCDSSSVDSERQYRTFVNIMDGKKPSVQIVDVNGDGFYNLVSDKGGSRKRVGAGSHNIIKLNKNENIDIDVKNNKERLAAMPEQALRPNWRQLR